MLRFKFAARKCVTTPQGRKPWLCIMWEISFNLYTQNQMRGVQNSACVVMVVLNEVFVVWNNNTWFWMRFLNYWIYSCDLCIFFLCHNNVWTNFQLNLGEKSYLQFHFKNHILFIGWVWWFRILHLVIRSHWVRKSITPSN